VTSLLALQERTLDIHFSKNKVLAWEKTLDDLKGIIKIPPVE